MLILGTRPCFSLTLNGGIEPAPLIRLFNYSPCVEVAAVDGFQ
jgi:hypothetical protein